MNLTFLQFNYYIINSLCEFLNFKPMKKNFFILMIIFTSTLAAQVVNVAEGNNINIANGATLDIAGLELTPNADYTIVGENSVSKESEVIRKPCVDQVCTASEIAAIEYILDEETDQKFGAGILYNINNRSAVTIEVMSSKVLDSSFKIGYQINF